MKVYFQDIRTHSSRGIFRVCLRSEHMNECVPRLERKTMVGCVGVHELSRLKNGSRVDNYKRDWFCVITNASDLKEKFDDFISAIGKAACVEVSHGSINDLKRFLEMDISEDAGKSENDEKAKAKTANVIEAVDAAEDAAAATRKLHRLAVGLSVGILVLGPNIAARLGSCWVQWLLNSINWLVLKCYQLWLSVS